MRFSTIVRILPMLMLIPAAAQAKPKWKTVYAGTDLTVAMDTAITAITTNTDGSYSVWTRWDYKRARILENKMSYTRLVERVNLKCSPILLKRTNTALYDRAGKEVKAPEELPNSEVLTMTWDPPKRGSDGERVWNAVCKRITGPKKK